MLLRMKTFHVTPELLFYVVRNDPVELHRASAISALTEWGYANRPLLRTLIQGEPSAHVRLTIANLLSAQGEHPRYFVEPLLTILRSA